MNTTENEIARSAAIRDQLQRHRIESGWTAKRSQIRSAKFAVLKQQYWNQYVAYREVWNGDTLVEPFVVAASADFGELNRLLDLIPAGQTDAVTIRFIGPALR